MRSLSTLSHRGLRRRPGRTMLTGAGAALGVAVLYAVIVVSGATTSALGDAVEGAAGDSDVVIEPIGTYDATLDPALVERIADFEGVERTLGQLGMRTLLYSPTSTRARFGDYDRIGFVVGTDLAQAGDIREIRLDAGALPAPGADEVIVSGVMADDLDVGPGDMITAASPGGVASLQVSGVMADVGAAQAFQGSVAYTSTETIRRLDGRGDVVSGIDVVLAPGVDAEEWIDAHRDAMGTTVSMRESRDVAAGFQDFITAISNGLVLMSLVAVFVGGFLVFLTFSMAVAERTRTYGTLRALGAQPAQVRRVVLTEAAVLGAAASVVGLVIGHLLASAGIGATESLLNLHLPALGLPVVPAAIGLAVGVGTSVLAAWLPGRRAAALGPVAAMREGATGIERRGHLGVRVAILVAGLAIGASGAGVTWRGLSVILVLLGSVLVVPFLLRRVAGVVGSVTRRLAPGTGRVAVLHLVKERSRSAYTLGLVMVVFAMVVAIAAANRSMADTLERVIDRQAGGAAQVGAAGALDPALGDELLALPEAAAVTPVRFGRTERLDGDHDVETELMVIEPDTYFDVASFAWVEGDDDSARDALGAGGAVLLTDGVAAGAGLERGDTVELLTTGGRQPFEVAGTFATIGQGFQAIASTVDGERFSIGRPNAFNVAAADGVDPEQLRLAVATRFGDEHDLLIDTAESTREFAFGQLQGFFSLAYVILVVAGVAGILGLANTLAVSVLSRTREIGILRSVGTRRRQVRAMVLVEALTLAVVALVLGAPLGLVLNLNTAGMFRDAIGTTVESTVPWALGAPLVVVTLLVAAAAAIVPARRAGRLDPVVALRFD